ncbi:MAG: hypothetical protein WC742_15070 [Gallionellaceae bacterium]|jgi:hypothetical protein
MIDRYLSIWEIAHRWRDVNPDKSDPTDLPLNIQDTIRYLCQGVLNGKLGISELIVMSSDGKIDGSYFRSEIRQYHVNEIPSELEDALYRKYDKNVLNAYFVEAENLFDYCLSQLSGTNSSLDFPSFWTDRVSAFNSMNDDCDDFEPVQALAEVQPLRPSQIDKLVCQAVAKTLWEIHPKMTIAAMIKQRGILIHGNGKLYTGKNTLRDWLSEVAPPDVKKPGRPKSIKPNNDAA